MTAMLESRTTAPPAMRKQFRGTEFVTSTDHKKIGYLYLSTSFAYFCFAGLLALIVRAQLFAPGLNIVIRSEAPAWDLHHPDAGSPVGVGHSVLGPGRPRARAAHPRYDAR
jgi:hypothetical protein